MVAVSKKSTFKVRISADKHGKPSFSVDNGNRRKGEPVVANSCKTNKTIHSSIDLHRATLTKFRTRQEWLLDLITHKLESDGFATK